MLRGLVRIAKTKRAAGGVGRAWRTAKAGRVGAANGGCLSILENPSETRTKSDRSPPVQLLI